MSHRAAIFLIEDGKIALIERHKQGIQYFSFPGGHVEEGESPVEAAVREAKEELGLDVAVKREIARMLWRERWQHYYLVERVGGTFGMGDGPELYRPVEVSGTYHPTWLPVGELTVQPVKPREVAGQVVRWALKGWPESLVIVKEE
jgi:8-oxo-dGTP diphosphatase